jgi:glycosyltransferase involved in cell wall biosynthesis
MQLTILMPCLNEAETLAICIKKALSWVNKTGIEAEVLISDNGSTDGSQEIARSLGARVLQVKERGYGSALYHGSINAKGVWIIMGDSDDSYDFSKLDNFIESLKNGCDLVMGNRFLGGIEDGAMPWKNRYIGNPILTWIGRMLFSCPVRDFHCGLRGFRKESFIKMDLRTTGMEFASEMVIKASLFGMKIEEVPTTLSRDGRSRPPHLRAWRDGWRHLRFMLLFSPRWLLLYPGLFLTALTTTIYLLILSGTFSVSGLSFGIHTLIYAEAGIVLGVLLLICGLVIKTFGAREGLLQKNSLITKIIDAPVLEIGTTVGFLILALGIVNGFVSLDEWSAKGFGELEPSELIKTVSVSTLLLMLGGITFITSLILGFLTLPTKERS